MSNAINSQTMNVNSNPYSPSAGGADLSPHKVEHSKPGNVNSQIQQTLNIQNDMAAGAAAEGGTVAQLTTMLVNVLQSLVELLTSMVGGGAAGAEGAPAGAAGAPPAGTANATATADANCGCPPDAGESKKSKGGFGDIFGGIMEKVGGIFSGLFGGLFGGGKEGGGGGMGGGIMSLFKGFF